MKIIASDVNKYFANKHTKRFYKELFASAFHIKNGEIMDAWFEHVCLVALSPTSNELFNRKLQFLLNLCERNVEIDEINTHETPLFESSPFYQRMIVIKKFVEETIRNSSISNDNDNSFFCPDLINLALKKYIPYLPLWSGLMLDDRLSNAPVENWFGLVKNNMLDGQTNFKPTRVIRKIRAKVLSLHRDVKLKISRKRCATQKRARLSEHTEETWKKKQKRAHTYSDKKSN